MYTIAKLSKAPVGWVLALFSNNPAAVRPSIRNSSNLTLQEAEIQYASFAKLSKAPAGWVLALFSNNPAPVRPSIRTSSNLTLQEAEIQYASPNCPN